jgi:hypothetical protein
MTGHDGRRATTQVAWPDLCPAHEEQPTATPQILTVGPFLERTFPPIPLVASVLPSR